MIHGPDMSSGRENTDPTRLRRPYCGSATRHFATKIATIFLSKIVTALISLLLTRFGSEILFDNICICSLYFYDLHNTTQDHRANRGQPGHPGEPGQPGQLGPSRPPVPTVQRSSNVRAGQQEPGNLFWLGLQPPSIG